MFRIKFLGSGGGRYVTAYQLRRTGGILIEDGMLVHVDPGPGATRALRDFGEDVRKIDGILVSHIHPDHVTEANIVIEGMTEGVKKKRGFILAPENVIEGEEDYRPVSRYHLSALERVVPVKEHMTVELSGAKLMFIPAKHTEPQTLGFVWKGKRTITYYSDTGYWEGMERFAEDRVIFNLETTGKSEHHTTPDVVRRVLSESSPSLVFITHFGLSVLRYGPERLAKELERDFGVEVIPTRDGLEWREKRERTLFDY